MGIVFSYIVKIFTYWGNYATISTYFRVRMMTMNLNQLEYFCAAVRYGNITQAAKKLFVTQPTISGAIRELEREFSVSLFSHTRNKLVLSEDGQRFYERAELLLREVETAKMKDTKIKTTRNTEQS